MKRLTIPFISTLSVLLISSCLGPAGKLLGFGDDKDTTAETTVTEQVINPTPTPLPTPTPPLIAVSAQEAAGISQASAEQIIDLLDLSAPSSQMRVARHNAGNFSFEIPPGWEVVHLEEDGEFLVCRIGNEVFGGATSDHPYVYFRLVPWMDQTLTASVLTDMRETLAGVDVAEDFTSPTLDDRSGVGQFVSGKLGGKGNVIHYRAYLLAVPLPDKKQLAQMIFWGPEDQWPRDAREMALVLETILWQAFG